MFCDSAEAGDYSEAENSSGYLSEFCFIPNQPQGFEKDVTKHHQQHRWESQLWPLTCCVQHIHYLHLSCDPTVFFIWSFNSVFVSLLLLWTQWSYTSTVWIQLPEHCTGAGPLWSGAALCKGECSCLTSCSTYNLHSSFNTFCTCWML